MLGRRSIKNILAMDFRFLIRGVSESEYFRGKKYFMD
jgi:hypothetical protein